MSTSGRWKLYTAGLLTALALAACGGGGGGDTAQAVAPASVAPSVLPQEPGAPTLLNNVPQDGMNWINYRRAQAGMPVLTRNELLDRAAAGHSEYQKANNIVSHEQTVGKPGFTGVNQGDRMLAAGYVYNRGTYAYGEVISATSNGSGFYMAEELITAIYHRFVIFEPKFKEVGTGAATTSAGYTYFTTNFAATNGYGPGVGSRNLVTWPFNGQVKVASNFFSDYEAPDPVPNLNEVGYPVSVHADIDVNVVVQSFTMRPRGGADLQTRLIKAGENTSARTSPAAAIVPLAVLKANTVYDVTFTGTLNGVPTTKTWFFTTK
ncbi:CAP domain-containing protein [Massilia sp. GCM10020059]|uniref:CAP domain-containing protein n=1 Tax=Massilia agrisoli TaxID=2892444 RepID=A0ABS8IPP8_9BURK|nr:CAP domain-containing protein [Massilia agrisoli]MCC6070592.1 CAP domain-containing protein [Massilia agrisoli]